VWGAVGAAIASVITQFFTNVMIGYIFKPIRRNNRLMLKALNPCVLFELAQEAFKHR
jgi:Na+-driven multidrug efflux pump